ncbi:HEAT repeat domain-containing protein [Planctomycetota bacterium]
MKNMKKKRRSSIIYFCFPIIVCLLMLDWPVVLACLDINPPPPGTPMELSLGRKTVTPNADPVTSGMGARKREKKKDDPDYLETREVEDVDIAKALKYNVCADQFEATGITTVDVEAHCPWINAKPKYTPNPGLLFRFMTGAHYLRIMLHPDSINKHELVNHLLDIGQAGLATAQEVAEEGKNEGDSSDIRFVARAVLACLGEAAGKLPKAEEGATAEETFINRLINHELGNAYLHQPQPGFARHIADMGDVMVPYLIAAAKKHKHQLVRRNAVGILGQMGKGEEVREALREIAKGDDMVAAIRALFSLARKKDDGIVPWLIERAKDDQPYKKNPSFRHMAVFCLGAIGHPDGVAPVMAWAKTAYHRGVKPFDKRNILWSSIQALARLRVNTPEAIALYRQVAKEYRSRRSCPVGDYGVLAGFAAGDPQLQKEFMKMVNDKNNPVAKFSPAARALAVEILQAYQGRLKIPYLLHVAVALNEDANIRFQAIARHKFVKKDVPVLKSIIQSNKAIAVVKSIALMRMWQFDRELCRKMANVLIDNYLGNKKASHLKGEGFEVVMAMKILGPEGGLPANKLTPLIERAYKDIKKSKKQPVTAKPEDVIYSTPSPIFENALMELGRLGVDEGIKYLKGTILDPDKPGREEAVRGLYFVGGDRAIDVFVKVLKDKDGWVRHYAAWGLTDITGVEYECDWAFGGSAETTKGVEFWRDWHEKYKKEKKDD